MKKVIRDVTVIVALFIGVLAVPLILEDSPQGERRQLPDIKTAPAQPETRATKNPPMPQPENNAVDNYFAPLKNAQPVQDPEPEQSGSCSLSGVRSHVSSTSSILNARGDSFIFGGAEDAGNAVTMTIDGAGGIDRLEIGGPGYIVLDGKKLRSVELIQVRNGVPNEIRIQARGLAALSSGHVVVDGDSSDKVVLPSCLEWREPVPVTVGDVNYMRYDANDSADTNASVSVASEVLVEKR